MTGPQLALAKVFVPTWKEILPNSVKLFFLTMYFYILYFSPTNRQKLGKSILLQNRYRSSLRMIHVHFVACNSFDENFHIVQPKITYHPCCFMSNSCFLLNKLSLLPRKSIFLILMALKIYLLIPQETYTYYCLNKAFLFLLIIFAQSSMFLVHILEPLQLYSA